MPLVNMKDMLQHAYDHSYAVGSFDLVSLDFLQGILDAAERCRAPVILSLSESQSDYYDFDLLASAVETAARRAAVPVAILFDHGVSLDSAIYAINRGCNGVMIDAASKSLSENINLTREVVAMAHACGVSVEAELGYVPGVEDDTAERHTSEIAYTTAAEARAYVEKTGIDSLAVSIGTVHGRTKALPKLDWQRLKQINDAVGKPLVIHGGSGLSDDQFRRLVANGVAKINYFTALDDAAGACIRRNLDDGVKQSASSLMQGMQQDLGVEAERCMRLSGAAGRAAEVLAQCESWHPVEQVILFNLPDLDEQGVATLVNEVRQTLDKTPGIREVITGTSLLNDSEYKYSWLIRFCHPVAVTNYREHPAHVSCAAKLLAPLTAGCISNYYQPRMLSSNMAAPSPSGGNGVAYKLWNY